ncbi:hypothetical protein BDZ94DRAFT_1233746 [Collybia nuda]|uniref:C2H2-type domain-containing protein n=1 Tax=Collybia nuda TaxID=64659 RepID=A0A9P6CHK3_9AGAR|nr:hypothetical protein BDZ94DRAFT_1233746 [Collybia nuda]
MRAIGGGYHSSHDVPYITIMDDPASTEVDVMAINSTTTYMTNPQRATHLVLPSLSESAYSPSEASTEDSIDSNRSFGELLYQREGTHRRSSSTILSSSDDTSIHSPPHVSSHVISPSTYDQDTAFAGVHANKNLLCNQALEPGIQEFGVLDPALSLSHTFSDSAALVPQRYSSDGCQRGYAVNFAGDPTITAPHRSSRYQDWQEAEKKLILDALSELDLHSPPVTASQPFRPVGTFAGTQASKQRRNNTRVNDCGKDFTTRHNLKYHMDAHRNIRPHACPACDIRSKKIPQQCITGAAEIQGNTWEYTSSPERSVMNTLFGDRDLHHSIPMPEIELSTHYLHQRTENRGRNLSEASVNDFWSYRANLPKRRKPVTAQ